ncbi:MAG: stage II sporulation protein P [Syntrophomonadaceae bacterium]|jgi:stage II sporulation protein P|nr:stage II sporulation protein P [Syntrophomonadaceae bacterium]
MNTLNKRYIWTFFLVLLLIMVAAYLFNIYASNPAPKYYSSDNQAIQCVTVRDTEGNIIFQTGEPVHVEDEYINEMNQHYIVTKVSGAEGIAEIKTQVPPPLLPPKDDLSSSNIFNHSLPTLAEGENIHVVIYHTHTDESYTPTSGTASEPGNGDILDIGKALQTSLQEEGISVTHSDNLHDPHDINAYNRSRRTAAQLIKEQPDAVFDIHRDSAPAQAYQTSINGVDSARVMIVIGRSNPNMQTNLEYAKRIKAAADELYPGLMRGIFMGKGDYNQDLYPTSILFECGTDQLSADGVVIAVHSLSDAIIKVLREK